MVGVKRDGVGLVGVGERFPAHTFGFNNNGIIEEIEHSNTDNYIGAGGVYSTLNDMSKWIVELFANDPIVIKNDIINEIQKPLVKIADGGHTFNKT